MLRLLLLVVLLVPAAEACSLREAPPSPAVFYIWDLQNDPLSVAVHGRGLGAGCELSNVHAIDEERFAWMEDGTIHVLGIATGERRTVAWQGDQPQDLALDGEDVLVRTTSGQGHERQHEVWRVAPDGAKERVHATTGFGRLHGPYFVTESPGVGITDMRTGEVVAEPQNASERGFAGDQEPHFIGTDGRYLVYGQLRATGYHVHDLQRGTWRDVDEGAHMSQVANGHLYFARSGNLTAIDLATGAKSTAEVPRVDLLGAGGGHVVLGSYSASTVEGEWRAAFADRQIPLPMWTVLLALAGVAVIRKAGPRRANAA